MSGHKVTRACCRSRTKAALYAVALGGVADFLGHREANARIWFGTGNGLQSKRRTPRRDCPGRLLGIARAA